MSLVEETEPESSEDYFHQLELKCFQDPFWSQNSSQVLDQPQRCQHCRHWIGQTDLAQQLQHILNGCKTFSQQVLDRSSGPYKLSSILSVIGSYFLPLLELHLSIK